MESIQSKHYPIHFEENGYHKLSNWIAENEYSSIFILVDENSMEFCYPLFIKHLETDINIEVIEIEAGEIYKNIDTCVGVWNVLTELNGDRKSLLITLGGGVITDLGGFVASTFKRGIDFINIPTTLLSMVDASVGGKTGVDLGVLKNQIGLFSNPKMVLVNTDFLQSLEVRQIKSGLAEIIKYGLTLNVSLFEEVKKATDLNLNYLIHESINLKNQIVMQDPNEKGLRKVLNFGHTVGHAIESYFLESENKESLTHGEAIAIGMVCESYISNKLLGFDIEKLNDIKQTIINIFGKTLILKEDIEPILGLLKHDKKNINGEVNFVLLNNIEDFELNCKASNDLVTESIAFYNE